MNLEWKKIKKYFIAFLVVFLLPVSVFADSNFEQMDEKQDALLLNRVANSWRFENGLPIYDEVTPLNDFAWSKVDGGYLNSEGKIIPDAVARGIDVSEFQGLIDWGAVKSDDIDFAIIRAAAWDGEIDTKFKQNAEACQQLDIPFGIYIYSYATSVEEARSEAAYVVSLLHDIDVELPVYIDLEDRSIQNADLVSIANAFCEYVQNAGYDAGIYANLYWWNNYLNDSSLDVWEKWVAQYNTECSYSKPYSCWQASSRGSIQGVNGAVDINFAMSSDFLNRTTMDDLAAQNKGTIQSGVYAVESAVKPRVMLEIEGASKKNLANAQLYQSDPSAKQYWKIEEDSNGYLTIINLNSGLALDVNGGKAQNSTNVQQYSPHGGKSQKWVAVVNDDGSVTLHSAVGLGFVLDVNGGRSANGTNVAIYSSHGGKSQRFFLYEKKSAEPKAKTLDDGIYIFEANGYALEIENGSTKNGGKLTLGSKDNSGKQSFTVRYDEQRGFYEIVASISNKSLDMWRADIVPGAYVSQWDAPGSGVMHRYWGIQDNEDGTVSIFNAATGLYLGVDSENRIVSVLANDNRALHFSVSTPSLPVSLAGRWDLEGGSKGALGSLASGVMHGSLPGEIYCRFDNGVITAVDAFDVKSTYVILGEIANTWLSCFDENVGLGFPISEDRILSSGHFQMFENGNIYSSSNGAFVVKKSFLEYFELNGGPEGELGYPISAEQSLPIQNGYSQEFEHGLLLWTRNLGVHRVDERFLNRYKADGGPSGLHGFPVSDSYYDRGVLRQDFQHGSYWDGPMPAGLYRHNVAWAGQPNNYYCGPTSGYMILNNVGASHSASGTALSIRNVANYMRTDAYGYTSFADHCFEHGMDNWLGRDIYSTYPTPSYSTVRDGILRSYQTGYAAVLDSQERRGGPHLNGHNNATFSHIMVVDGYDSSTDKLLLVDPGARTLWRGSATHFWYPGTLKQFVANHLAPNVQMKGHHIGMIAPH